MELSKIAAAIEQDEPTTRGIISDMMTAYEKQNRGIRIIELDHSFQLWNVQWNECFEICI